MAPQTVQTIPQPSHKRRNVIIATIIGVLILIIGAWAVVAAINSMNKKGTGGTISANDTTTASRSDSASNNDNHGSGSNNINSTSGTTNTSAGSSAGSNTSSPANNYTPTNKTNDTPAATPSAPVNNVPTTGPEDLLPTFLLVGIATYLVTLNFRLRRERHAIKV